MKILYLLIMISLATGCADNKLRLTEEAKVVFPTLKSKKIAVRYDIVNSKINYNELLYRVLWLENNSSVQDFSGIWSNPSLELSAYLAESMHKAGYQVSSVYDVIANPTLINRERLSYAELCNRYSNQKNTPYFVAPEQLFNIDNFDEFSALSESLKQNQFNYLLELSSMTLVAHQTMLSTIVSSSFNARLVDLQSNKVIWSRYIDTGTGFFGTIQELEQDSLKQLKETLKTSLNNKDFNSFFDTKNYQSE